MSTTRLDRLLACSSLLCSLCLGGCKVAGARVYNLRTLHEEDGRHVRIAVLYADLEYLLRNGLLGLVPGATVSPRKKEPKEIKDPLGTCLENAHALSDFTGDDVVPLQIETFAMLSLKCPWKLSRELAVVELGHAGERLELAKAPQPLTPPPAPAVPQQVADALSALVRAVTPSEELSAQTIQQACDGIAALSLDGEGAQRALRATALLAQRFGASDEDGAPIRALVTDLEQRCVRLGLAAGLVDVDPLVRAAAVAADVRVFGPERLGTHLDRLDPRLPDAESSDVVAVRVLVLIRKHGLAESAGEQFEQRLRLVYEIATHHPNSYVRVCGMRALERLSGGTQHGLREEDWQAWYLARTPVQP